jgi:hypothetical protein
MMLLGFSSSSGGEAAYSNSIAHDKEMYGSESTSIASTHWAFEMDQAMNTSTSFAFGSRFCHIDS